MSVRPLSPSPKKRRRWIKAYLAGLGVVWMLAASGILPSLYGERTPEPEAMAHGVAEAEPATTRWFSPGPGIKPLDIARSSRAAMLSATAGAPDAFGRKTYALFVATETGDETPVEVASIEAGPLAVASIAATEETSFDRVAKEARLSSSQVASILKRARKAPVSDPVAAARAIDAAKKQIAETKPSEVEIMPVLAFASASPTSEDGALAAISAMAANRGELARKLEAAETDEGDEDAAIDEEIIVTPVAPEFAELPDAVHAPATRPKIDDATRALLQAKKPEKDKKEEETRVAFAKPDDVLKKSDEAPKKSGSWFGFGRSHPKAGNGVAVYDISAATVYMPDGTKLEAHSGIGNMVDNPDYVHVKMNGPTPPHTYNLRMREKLFHGVEAIRMLPVDGKNKHGRDGFLTHSYLLGGARRGQSHGCVAFKDYDKFLNAFKAGKVRQIIVVPGNGKGSSKKRKDPAVAENRGGSDA